jgi:tetratricopeptide (TPR) repeat protein
VLWRLAILRAAQQDLADAAELLERAIAVLERVAATDPGRDSHARALITVYRDFGEVAERQGDRARALAAYDRALGRAARLSRPLAEDEQIIAQLRQHKTRLRR